MKYRAEIDGLRTIAVVPVILFHAGFEAFSGGFVGVDVFFVISGYLITSILLADLDQGRYSILTFYERRARRIAPALFAMLAFVCAGSWWLMPPPAFNDLGRTILSVVLFVSNFDFMQNVGYFATDAERNPLLHTWSLAVEEQFYIVFPVLLAVLWRISRRAIVPVLVGVGLASLAGAIYGAGVAPDKNFFFTPTRAWELIAGALCAIYQSHGSRAATSGGRARWLAAAGLAGICLSVVCYDSAVAFPSAWTLLPVGGTVLVILFAAPDVGAGRVLSAPIMVGIGLISYSAYLFHQPLFAFARIASPDHPGALLMLGLSLLSLGLGYLSWRFIEAPFRRGKSVWPRRRSTVFALTLGAMGLASGFGVLVALRDGFVHRMPIHQVVTQELAGQKDTAPCMQNNRIDRDQVDACLAQPGTVVLIGDSHAGAISRALRDALAQEGRGLLTLTRSGCLPLEGVRRAPADRYASCTVFAQQVRDILQAHPEAPLVAMVRWPSKVRRAMFDNQDGGAEPWRDIRYETLDPDGSWNAAGDVMAASLAQLRKLGAGGRLVVVPSSFPEAGWHVPDRVYALALWHDHVPTFGVRREVIEARSEDIRQVLLAAQTPRLRVPDLTEAFCGPDLCLSYDAGKLYHFDGNHPSPRSARRIADQIVAALTPPLSD